MMALTIAYYNLMQRDNESIALKCVQMCIKMKVP